MKIAIIIAAIAVIPLFLIFLYNQLVKNRNQIENSISSLDALFMKRSDLIPNLVEVVQQHMKFEDDMLTKITSLRTVNSSTNPSVEMEAQQALKSMMIQVENYPDLKSNQQFLNLQYSMNEVEEQISAGRRYVSSSITVYNNSVKTFPNNLVASVGGFKEYDWVYATEKQRENVEVKDLFNKNK